MEDIPEMDNDIQNEWAKLDRPGCCVLYDGDSGRVLTSEDKSCLCDRQMCQGNFTL